MSTYDDRDTAIHARPDAGAGLSADAPAAAVLRLSAVRTPVRRRLRHARHGHAPRRRLGDEAVLSDERVPRTLLCILGICITAASTNDLDSHGAALFSAILVAAYTVSRGIAKAGTRSRANDFRDDLNLGSHGGQQQQQHDHQHAG